MLRLLLLSALVAGPVAAQGLNVGDAVPLDSQTFTAADGSQTTLAAQSGRAGLVVAFWSNACPWADRYAPRLASLIAQYTPAGVGFVLVNSNDPAAQTATPEASREAATSAGLAVPYLADPDGGLAEAFGASNTPHVFFFDGAGALRYDGTIDDSPTSADRVRVPYLAQAMDQSIAGLAVEVQRTQAFGCTIDRAGE